ncbi:site-specific DNA-methyltransferase [Carnobacterium maltaromaticum]|uniref:site-specific DNA-methyltransferase n=1 Tax=Carnobacterium maltaromaticum TaxID=2751 RepID=UPI00298BAD46|nr:site-specific DNA-methyltransferase [Carnobacterium maltaromaticum]MDW5525315.1 site-specific DNA-methyltransferase [Carnobacterium maltaromaticum]
MRTNQKNTFHIDKIAHLKNIIPEVFQDDQLNFIELKELLNGYLTDDEYYYAFTWRGKNEAKKGAYASTTSTLKPNKEKSEDFENTNNLYIEGDNLEVLKVLRDSYTNKVNMIYIDPPYNTGKEFIYSDNFEDSEEAYKEFLGIINENGEKTSTGDDISGRTHTSWLNMMYPRLLLARDFLSDDGFIFINIDDNEQANLKKICDDIFGRMNFIGQIIRNTNSSKNQSLFLSTTHDYCLVYSKNISSLKEKHKDNKWAVAKNNINEYVNKINQLRNKDLSNAEITEELKELTNYPRFTDFINYWYVDNRGVYRKDNLGGVSNGNLTPVINPITGVADRVPPGGFRYSSEKMQELVEDDRIHFHIDGSLPTLKRYLYDNIEQRPKSIMSDDQRPDYSMLKEFGIDFDNPKQLTFMERIISIADNDALVMDFFSGSSTTAHAVMSLNAKDNGNRKFIMVQLPEPIEDPRPNQYGKTFYTIAEAGQERIRKAGEKILNENPELEGKIDVGFKLFELSETNFPQWNENITEEKISEQLEVLAGEVKNEEHAVYEILILLKNYLLDEKVEEVSPHLYSLGSTTRSLVSVSEEISSEMISWIIENKENYIRIILYDNSLTQEQKFNLSENLGEQLETI